MWYREARVLGLDQDDTVVRRRLRQKMEFLSEDFDATVEPTEEELQAYLIQHPEQFRIGSTISFTQVYQNADRRGDDVYRDAQRLRSQLIENPGLLENPAIGDQLLTLQPNTWSEPVKSGYGLHVVFVRERLMGDSQLWKKSVTR